MSRTSASGALPPGIEIGPNLRRLLEREFGGQRLPARRDVRGCLAEDDVLDFFDGRLSEAALAELELHLDHCRTCRDLLELSADLVVGEDPPARTGVGG